MVKPYIVKFVSMKSGVGKTRLASSIVRVLKQKGYVVGVVKHCAHGVDVEEKDSHVYIASGADIVIASSRDLGVIYRSRWLDSLQHIVSYIDTPIIVVEGFKESLLGDTIVVAEDLQEALTLDSKRVALAYVVKNLGVEQGVVPENINVFTLDDVEKLSNLIERRALDYIHNQLPQTNCKYCGYNSCMEFAIAYAKGFAKECPVKSNVKLVVDGKDIELNPFVKRLLKSLIFGFINELKDVPKEPRNVVIKIERSFG